VVPFQSHASVLRRSSLSTLSRCLIAAAGGAGLCLFLLVIHVFVPNPWLQLVAVWFLTGSFLAAWLSLLTWRAPVFAHRTLGLIALVSCLATGLSLLMVYWTMISERSPLWQRSVQSLALALSLAGAGWLLRALLRKRTSPILGRLLSLLAPLAILLWIVTASLRP